MTSSSTERHDHPTVLRDPGVVVAPYAIRPLTGSGGTASTTSVRSAAQTEGYATGWAQGIREARLATTAARQQFAAELTDLLARREQTTRDAIRAIEAAAAQLRAHLAEQAEDIADTVLATAVDLAEVLVGARLSAATTPGQDALRRALAHIPPGDTARVRLNPADHAELVDAQDGVDAEGRTVVLVADDSIARGDAIAETTLTTVDARLATALARIRQECGL